MAAWRAFLDSLATRGGNILVLVVCVFAFYGLVFHTLHHAEQSTEVRTVILSTFSGFTGALIGALTGGSSSKQRAADGSNPNGEVKQ